MYLWIFGGCYLIALVVAFFFLSQRARAVSDELLARGMGPEAVDDFYASVGRTTLRALIQSTLIAGTLLGAFCSLVWWLATK